MKYFKRLSLFAVLAAALMASTGTASAIITSPPGTVLNATVHMTSTNTSFDGIKWSCSISTISGSVSKGFTSYSVSSWTFQECGKDTVSVIKAGNLSIASNGAVTSTGAEITVQLHRSVLGFPVTTHCIYATKSAGEGGTSIGALTEGVAPASLHIGSSPIPEVATDGACGNDAVWTGSYTVSTPSSAIVID